MFCLSPLNRVVLACALFSLFSSGIVQFGLMSCTLTTVRDHFGVSNTAMAAAITCFQLSQILCSFVLPSLEQRWPRCPPEMLCGIGMMLSVIGAIIYGAAVRYPMLVIAQLINGIGGACVYLFMPSMFARLIAVPTMMSMCVAKSFALTPVGIVVASVSCNQAVESWRWLYIGFGFCLVIPAAVFFYAGWSYRTHDPRHSVRAPPKLSEVRQSVLQDPKLMLSVVGITCTAFLIAAYSTFLPTYIEDHLGNSKQSASLVMASTVPAVSIGTLVGGSVTKRWHFTQKQLLRWLSCFCFATFSVVQIAFPGNIRTLWVNIVVFVLTMFTTFMCSGPAVAVIAQMLPKHMISHGQSAVNIVTRAIGGIGGPLAMAAISDSSLSFNMAFFLVSWIMLIAAAVYAAAAWLCPASLQVDVDEYGTSTTTASTAPEVVEAGNEPSECEREEPENSGDPLEPTHGAAAAAAVSSSSTAADSTSLYSPALPAGASGSAAPVQRLPPQEPFDEVV